MGQKCQGGAGGAEAAPAAGSGPGRAGNDSSQFPPLRRLPETPGRAGPGVPSPARSGDAPRSALSSCSRISFRFLRRASPEKPFRRIRRTPAPAALVSPLLPGTAVLCRATRSFRASDSRRKNATWERSGNPPGSPRGSVGRWFSIWQQLARAARVATPAPPAASNPAVGQRFALPGAGPRRFASASASHGLQTLGYGWRSLALGDGARQHRSLRPLRGQQHRPREMPRGRC